MFNHRTCEILRYATTNLIFETNQHAAEVAFGQVVELFDLTRQETSSYRPESKGLSKPAESKRRCVYARIRCNRYVQFFGRCDYPLGLFFVRPRAHFNLGNCNGMNLDWSSELTGHFLNRMGKRTAYARLSVDALISDTLMWSNLPSLSNSAMVLIVSSMDTLGSTLTH